MIPKDSANMPSSVPQCKKAGMYLGEQITCMLDKFHSTVSYSAVGCEFIVNEPIIQLNKLSLNRNTHQTRLCIDKNVVTRDSQRANPEFLLGAAAQYLLIEYSQQLYRT